MEDKKIIILVLVCLILLLMSSSIIASYFIFFNLEETTQQAPQPVQQPTQQPTPQPSPQPTPQPSPQPTSQPSPQPIPQPSPQPTPQPKLIDIVDKQNGWQSLTPSVSASGVTEEQCLEQALKEPSVYSAWGFRTSQHPGAPNTCFLYKGELKPFAGNNDKAHVIGCLRKNDKLEFGCKPELFKHVSFDTLAAINNTDSTNTQAVANVQTSIKASQDANSIWCSNPENKNNFPFKWSIICK